MYDFRLQRTDGSPADPPTYRTGVYSWRPGDTIPMSATRGTRCSEFKSRRPDWDLRASEGSGGIAVASNRRAAVSGCDR